MKTKAKKPLGKDAAGIQKTMRVSDYLTDALGNAGLFVVSQVIGQLTYFYTDKIGVAAGAVGTLLLIVKIIDAFTDVIMGAIIDRTAPGKERYRPWLLRTSVLLAVLMIVMFTVPNVGSTGQLAYILITNLVLSSIVYTAASVPYWSLVIVRTESQEERGYMGTWRAAMGYAAAMVVACTIIPVTNALGGTQSAWVKYGVLAGAVVFLTLLLCWRFSKEKVVSDKEQPVTEEEEQADKTPFFQAVKMLFHNKYWVLSLAIGFFTQITYSLGMTSSTCYSKWIFGDDNLTALFSGIMLIPTVLGFAFFGVLNKKWGPTKSVRFGIVLQLIGTALRILNPKSLPYTLVMFCIQCFGQIIPTCLNGTLGAMAVDYNEYLYGNRMVAKSSSVNSFGGKVGSGIGGSLIGWMLGLAAYDATAAAATPAVEQAIYGFCIYIPTICCILLVILSFKFDLEKKIPEYSAEIAARKERK